MYIINILYASADNDNAADILINNQFIGSKWLFPPASILPTLSLFHERSFWCVHAKMRWLSALRAFQFDVSTFHENCFFFLVFKWKCNDDNGGNNRSYLMNEVMSSKHYEMTILNDFWATIVNYFKSY